MTQTIIIAGRLLSWQLDLEDIFVWFQDDFFIGSVPFENQSSSGFFFDSPGVNPKPVCT
jgi:hypothetical protein